MLRCTICVCLIMDLTQVLCANFLPQANPTDMPMSSRDLIKKGEKMATYIQTLSAIKVVPSEQIKDSVNSPDLMVENERIHVPTNQNGLDQVTKIQLDRRKLQRYMNILDLESATNPGTIQLDPSRVMGYVQLLNDMSRSTSRPEGLVYKSRIKSMKGSSPIMGINGVLKELLSKNGPQEVDRVSRGIETEKVNSQGKEKNILPTADNTDEVVAIQESKDFDNEADGQEVTGGMFNGKSISSGDTNDGQYEDLNGVQYSVEGDQEQNEDVMRRDYIGEESPDVQDEISPVKESPEDFFDRKSAEGLNDHDVLNLAGINEIGSYKNVVNFSENKEMKDKINRQADASKGNPLLTGEESSKIINPPSGLVSAEGSSKSKEGNDLATIKESNETNLSIHGDHNKLILENSSGSQSQIRDIQSHSSLKTLMKAEDGIKVQGMLTSPGLSGAKDGSNALKGTNEHQRISNTETVSRISLARSKEQILPAVLPTGSKELAFAQPGSKEANLPSVILTGSNEPHIPVVSQAGSKELNILAAPQSGNKLYNMPAVPLAQSNGQSIPSVPQAGNNLQTIPLAPQKENREPSITPVGNNEPNLPEAQQDRTNNLNMPAVVGNRQLNAPSIPVTGNKEPNSPVVEQVRNKETYLPKLQPLGNKDSNLLTVSQVENNVPSVPTVLHVQNKEPNIPAVQEVVNKESNAPAETQSGNKGPNIPTIQGVLNVETNVAAATQLEKKGLNMSGVEELGNKELNLPTETQFKNKEVNFPGGQQVVNKEMSRPNAPMANNKEPNAPTLDIPVPQMIPDGANNEKTNMTAIGEVNNVKAPDNTFMQPQQLNNAVIQDKNNQILKTDHSNQFNNENNGIMNQAVFEKSVTSHNGLDVAQTVITQGPEANVQALPIINVSSINSPHISSSVNQNNIGPFNLGGQLPSPGLETPVALPAIVGNKRNGVNTIFQEKKLENVDENTIKSNGNSLDHKGFALDSIGSDTKEVSANVNGMGNSYEENTKLRVKTNPEPVHLNPSVNLPQAEFNIQESQLDTHEGLNARGSPGSDNTADSLNQKEAGYPVNQTGTGNSTNVESFSGNTIQQKSLSKTEENNNAIINELKAPFENSPNQNTKQLNETKPYLTNSVNQEFSKKITDTKIAMEGNTGNMVTSKLEKGKEISYPSEMNPQNNPNGFSNPQIQETLEAKDAKSATLKIESYPRSGKPSNILPKEQDTRTNINDGNNGTGFNQQPNENINNQESLMNGRNIRPNQNSLKINSPESQSLGVFSFPRAIQVMSNIIPKIQVIPALNNPSNTMDLFSRTFDNLTNISSGFPMNHILLDNSPNNDVGSNERQAFISQLIRKGMEIEGVQNNEPVHEAFPLHPKDEVSEFENINDLTSKVNSSIKQHRKVFYRPTKPPFMYDHYYNQLLDKFKNINKDESLKDVTDEKEILSMINKNLGHLHVDKGALCKIISKALTADNEEKDQKLFPKRLDEKYDEARGMLQRGKSLEETPQTDSKINYNIAEPVYPRAMEKWKEKSRIYNNKRSAHFFKQLILPKKQEKHKKAQK